jgi:hypothetical protein
VEGPEVGDPDVDVGSGSGESGSETRPANSPLTGGRPSLFRWSNNPVNDDILGGNGDGVGLDGRPAGKRRRRMTRQRSEDKTGLARR